jgi:predicted porin
MKEVIRHMIASNMLIMLCLSTSAQELRFGINYDKKIIPKLEIDSKVQLRTIVNQENSFYSIAQLGMDYKISDNISVAGSVRYSTAHSEIDEKINEEINEKLRYTADLKLSTERFDNGTKIKNRLRYQYSAVITGDDKNYVRNKLSIDYKLTRRMKPYVAVEPYLLLDNKKIRKLRFYLGSEFELKNNELEFCFIVEGKSRDKVISMYYKAGIHYKF